MIRSALSVFSLALFGAILCAPACGSPPPDKTCPGPQPAFRVVITAAHGPLPRDTVVRVKSGSGTEEYALASPPDQPKIVFCSVPSGDGGDSGDAPSNSNLPDAAADAARDASSSARSVDALLCLLWTNGAADVTIQGLGYPNLTETLQAKKNDCGIMTVDENLVLGAADGG